MIVSIDPGETSGVAIYAGGPTPAVADFHSPSLAVMRELLGWCAAKARERDESLVLVIEDQYAQIRWVKNLRTGRLEATIDWPALAKLTRNAERWVVVAEDSGAQIVRLNPTIWKGTMLGLAARERDDGKKLNEKQRATLAVAKIWREIYRFKGLPEPDRWKLTKVARLNSHIRDAMLIGRHYQLHGEARS